MICRRPASIISFLALCAVALAGPGAGAQVLLQPADLVYQGAFRVPPGKLGAQQEVGFAYGGTALAYNPAHDSLFVVGHVYDQMTAEIGIPAIVNGTSLGSLQTATVLQQFSDALEGALEAVDPGEANGFRIGGHLVHGGRLVISDYTYYDADTSQVTSHFARPLDLGTTGQVQGPVQVGTAGAGFVSGYMATIPPEWQAALGGPALTGNCCLSIIGRTSLGPAASVFDPADVGIVDPVPATALVGYPSGHPTLGTWSGDGSAHPVYNMATEVKGLVFPQGSRTVLFFGRTGLGTPCYGTGGASGGDCHDPADSSKGTHAYPYAYYAWAYDANDLVAVKNGQQQPWDVVPYASWSFDLPFGDDGARLLGAAYDPATQRIFVAQDHGDAAGLDPLPLLHVFHVEAAVVADGGVADATPPADGAGPSVADGGPPDAGAADGDATPPDPDGGCACTGSRGAGQSALPLLAAAALLVRRRRARRSRGRGRASRAPGRSQD